MNEGERDAITSERLELVLLPAEVLHACSTGDEEAVQRMLPFAVPREWYEAGELCRLRLEQVTKDAGYKPWGLRAMLLREGRQMVGFINCHSKPRAVYLKPYSEQGVEFGYTVFPRFRRRGYAREACQALVRWAHEVQGVPEFILSIAPENIASRRLAEGLGFIQVGTWEDEEDGREEVFKLKVGDV